MTSDRTSGNSGGFTEGYPNDSVLRTMSGLRRQVMALILVNMLIKSKPRAFYSDHPQAMVAVLYGDCIW